MIQPERHTNTWSASPAGDAFRPLVFGEALFDHFADGSRVLGGAPFNVAWHLRGFKARPLMVTAVGRDADGQEIMDRMARWGLDTTGVQTHPIRPTGRVAAHLAGGQPRYEIKASQAYDAVAVEQLPSPTALSDTSLLYHGTLALREETSAGTLSYLKQHLDVPVLVDVNLRDPWWGLERTLAQIRGPEWMKVNREEASLLTGRPVGTDDEVTDTAEVLGREMEVGTVVVTLGADGALGLGKGGVVRSQAPILPGIVDTVGAGDAFSAVLALGIHRAWPLPVILHRASAFAGEICRIRGAIPSDPSLYSRYLRKWDHAS